MKKITYVLFVVIFLFSVNAAIAQKAVTAKVLTAKVQLHPEKAKFFPNSVTIEFSQVIQPGLEFYQVISAGKSKVKGQSELIMDLYYEPGLLADSIYIYGRTVELVFKRGIPNEAKMTNILNRIIQIVHGHVASESRLEVDNYNPLMGVTLVRLANYKVPPPAIIEP